MPRRRRVVAEDAVYHLYNRLARGAELLAADDEADRSVDLLAPARGRNRLAVLAWWVMPNHYHLAAST